MASAVSVARRPLRDEVCQVPFARSKIGSCWADTATKRGTTIARSGGQVERVGGARREVARPRRTPRVAARDGGVT